MRTYLITCLHADDGRTEYREYSATSLAEALTMAERDHVADIYGIQPEDYAQARTEGIAFNEADGLLTGVC